MNEDIDLRARMAAEILHSPDKGKFAEHYQRGEEAKAKVELTGYELEFTLSALQYLRDEHDFARWGETTYGRLQLQTLERIEHKLKNAEPE